LRLRPLQVLTDLCVSFVESISGCMTYAFAARPAGTFFCPSFFCLHFRLVAAGRAKHPVFLLFLARAQFRSTTDWDRV